MTHFPLFRNIKNQSIIIFGGGKLALSRIERLLPFSPEITVISPAVSDDIKAIRGITVYEREFSQADLDSAPAFVVIAQDRETTARIYAACQSRHIPVNAVDMPEYCDIIFPALFATEHLCVAVSSSGVSPTAAVEFRDRFEKSVPDNIDSILEWMLDMRENTVNTLAKEKKKTALRELFSKALDKNRPLDNSETDAVLSNI